MLQRCLDPAVMKLDTKKKGEGRYLMIISCFLIRKVEM